MAPIRRGSRRDGWTGRQVPVLAGLAVWLGMRIDGVPESIAIGSGFVGLPSTRVGLATLLGFLAAISFKLLK